jgi:hypothetical protein
LVLYKPPANGKPGRVVTGTLVGNEFTRKGAFSTRRWTNIAVGRDSMAFYDRGTGKLLTGKFRNGAWKPNRTRTIAKGYTHLIASCDTLLLSRVSTNAAVTAEFTSGDIRDVRRVNLAALGISDPRWRVGTSSCDTLKLRDNLRDEDEFGLLRYGHYEHVEESFGAQATHLAANRTSYLSLDMPLSGPAPGRWGSLQGGDDAFGGSADTFSRWDAIAGAGDAIFFYIRSTGQAHAWQIVAGAAADSGAVSGVGKGWRIIAGGK